MLSLHGESISATVPKTGCAQGHGFSERRPASAEPQRVLAPGRTLSSAACEGFSLDRAWQGTEDWSDDASPELTFLQVKVCPPFQYCDFLF